MLAVLNSAKNQLRQSILRASHIIITLGTSFIYKLKSNNQVVANCHKRPQDHFQKQLSSVLELEHILKQFVSKIQELNKEVQLIFTVSPVRHTKEGVVENQRSKAHLIAALHQVLEQHLCNCSYFPSYEFMIDEFRDYRFYKRDLIHPSDLAVDMIWEKFKYFAILEDVAVDMKKVEKLQKSLEHRLTSTSGEAYEKLVSFQIKLKQELSKKYTFMDFQTI
jgi:hypothetical protein